MIRAAAAAVVAAFLVLALNAGGQKYSPVMDAAFSCSDGDTMRWSSGSWACAAPTAAEGSIPAGAILMVDSGTCPTGFTEHAALGASRFAMGTTNAAGDVGNTGGANTFTPAGTNSAPTFTGNALGTHSHGAGTLATSAHSGAAVADHAAHTHTVTTNVAVDDHASHTHTYSQVINHTHTVSVTDPGHVHAQASQTATTGGASSWEHGAIDASSTAAETLNTASATTGITATTANPAGGVATGTTAGPSATLSHTVTNNQVTSGNPSATLSHSVTQPADHTLSGSTQAITAGTPAGTVSAPTFTGTPADQRPAYVKVIYCEKN